MLRMGNGRKLIPLAVIPMVFLYTMLSFDVSLFWMQKELYQEGESHMVFGKRGWFYLNKNGI